MPLTWQLKAGMILLACATVLGGLWAFVHAERAQGAADCKVAATAASMLAREQTQQQDAALSAVAVALAASQASREVIHDTITRTVKQIVDRPVYRTQCIDADGLRYLNSVLGGTAGKADSAGEPASGVPVAPAASRADGR